jgi:acyl-CoA reductase-like NAD-dependent aldehyde dehydrogenase
MSSTQELASTSVVDGTEVATGAADFINEGAVTHFIDGKPDATSASGLRDIINPSTGHKIGEAARGDAADLDRAVRAAQAAWEDGRWRDLTPRDREARLHRLGDLVQEHAQIIGDLDSLNAGILRAWSDFIAQYSATALHYFAGWPTKLAGHIPPVGPDYVVQERREPVGVVGIIKPWNGPAAIFAQSAPALAVGNSVVLKPAELTPLSAAYMARLALEAGIPPGVFNVVHGDGVVGAAMSEHPGISRLSFTGSVATGRRVALAAAQNFKKVNLELGGKSPVLVFADADLPSAAAAAARAVWSNSGQVCTAGSRTLVHRSIYDDFVAEVIRCSEDLRVGHAFDRSSDLGPLVSRDQLSKVQGFVEAGKAEGATLCFEGNVGADLDGFYQAPVIFGDVTASMTIASEEIFGPVMSILPFEDEAEAYRLANATRYGLAAGVFTRDIATAERATKALDAGTVWINCYQVTDVAVSYGGTKESGYGRSLGEPALDEYTRRKSVWSRNY